jgi:hypothetical protein
MTYRPKSTFKGVSIKLLFEQLRAVGHSEVAALGLLVSMLEHPGTETEPVLPAWWKLELNGDRIAIRTPAGSLDPAEVFARKNGLAVNGPPPAGGTVLVPSAEDWRKYGAQAPHIWRLRAAQEEYARRKAARQPTAKEPEPSPIEPVSEATNELSQTLPAAEPAAGTPEQQKINWLAAKLKPDDSVKRDDHKAEFMTKFGSSEKHYLTQVWPAARVLAGLPRQGSGGRKPDSGNKSKS